MIAFPLISITVAVILAHWLARSGRGVARGSAGEQPTYIFAASRVGRVILTRPRLQSHLSVTADRGRTAA
ncbi:hypothetical protein ATO11_00445 [Pseudaestuariivita atlantica]|uniref:Uncharacterized protein n=2 Tax=Pseudaestuariivita atlantica TaxID=1317121 RepID=A0A0L1JTZ1_9RHOB|nr:hypothetical protein ATO11_00445 [Pseudaestuariivita atlantica]